jgi:hypothetical protein
MADGHEAISTMDTHSAGDSASVGARSDDSGSGAVARLDTGGGQHADLRVRSGIADELRYEISEAQALLLSLADVVGVDDDLAASIVEGETNLVEALNKAVARKVELDIMISGISDMMDAAGKRLDRFKKQQERIRDLICIAMETAGMKKLETPLATVSLKKVPPSLIVTNEADIPSSFWKQPPPTLDKRELLAALKDGPIAGAHLSNGGQTISFKAN